VRALRTIFSRGIGIGGNLAAPPLPRRRPTKERWSEVRAVRTLQESGVGLNRLEQRIAVQADFHRAHAFDSLKRGRVAGGFAGDLF